MKLAAYLRVSTVGQVEDGQGLEMQAKAVRTWAKANDHRIIATFTDEGISGTLEDREGLEDAIASVKFNGAEGIVVSSLDRLARSLTVQEAALQQVWNAGGKVFATDTGEVLADDPDDPVRTFVRQVLGAVSQLEAGMIARRLRRGRNHKRETTGWAGGQVPYGFQLDGGGGLIPDTDEQKVIGQMVALRKDGQSIRSIVRYLNDAGIPSKHGGQWHPRSLGRVLERES